MRVRRILLSVAFAAAMAAVPLSPASAQYYPPCSPFPLSWPFCAAGAVVYGAATIVTAPFRAIAGQPYYGYYGRPYYPPPGYAAPGYYPSAPGNYPPPNYGQR